MTALHYAAYHGHASILQLLIQQYPTLHLNIPDHEGNTTLMKACSQGHGAVVTYLVDTSIFMHTIT
jgi:ankyrin repeat protein